MTFENHLIDTMCDIRVGGVILMVKLMVKFPTGLPLSRRRECWRLRLRSTTTGSASEKSRPQLPPAPHRRFEYVVMLVV